MKLRMFRLILTTFGALIVVPTLLAQGLEDVAIPTTVEEYNTQLFTLLTQNKDLQTELETLKARLNSTQTRYDNENVSRLLAEKKLILNKGQIQSYQRTSTKAHDNYRLLAEQFEQSQALTAELREELNEAKSQIVQLKQQTSAATSDATSTQSAPRSVSESANEEGKSVLFQDATEWVLEGLDFGVGTADLKPNSRSVLVELLDYMQTNPAHSIFIGGHSDSSGDPSENSQLSQDRAEMVHLYLIENGIDSKRIASMGFGSKKPLYSNETAEGRAGNRRVSITVVD